MPAVLGSRPPHRPSNTVPEVLGVVPLDDKSFSVQGDRAHSGGTVAFDNLACRVVQCGVRMLEGLAQ